MMLSYFHCSSSTSDWQQRIRTMVQEKLFSRRGCRSNQEVAGSRIKMFRFSMRFNCCGRFCWQLVQSINRLSHTLVAGSAIFITSYSRWQFSLIRMEKDTRESCLIFDC